MHPSITRRHRRIQQLLATLLGLPLALAAERVSAQTGSGSAADNTVSLPDGAGTPQSMGENFRADLSTGTVNLTVPLAMPKARGDAQPSLLLTYNSTAGSGVVGSGFTTGVPFIARQAAHGPPRYVDPTGETAWDPKQDRFVYNGSELVPICRVGAGPSCSGAASGEVMPAWATGWRYFRHRVEADFQRVFWSPDGRTWRIQDPSGLSLELGVSLDGSGDANALETEGADGSGRIFRWNLTRQYDTHAQGNPHAEAAPRPYNVVAYRYLRDSGIAYLSDVYDTPPAADPSAPLSGYAHHTRLTWEQRPDIVENYRRGWLVRQALRLARVDVTSKSFTTPTAARRLVRRYHLSYYPDYHTSQLKAVQLEGRCAGEDDAATPSENGQQLLPATSCKRLPALQFDYGRVTRPDGTRPPLLAGGFEGFDTTVRSLPQSPRFTADGVGAELFDINADGLPDLFLPQPTRFSGDHAIILNGANGTKGAFGNPVRMPVVPLGSVNASELLLSNQNVVPLDLDGDGVLNLVHMPARQRPSLFAPTLVSGQYRWTGRTTTTDPSLNPKIDLTNRNQRVRIADVDGDGVVDVVVDSGTQLETYFSLARFPNGDGKFGQAVPTGVGTVQLSADPRTACVPSSGTAVRFSDPAVRFADVNADGIVDILRLRDRNIEYWPGRGDGVWGTGNVGTCVAGTFGENRHVAMGNSPTQVGVSGSITIFDDVNGDGFPDLMLVGRGTTSLWLNVDGQRWSSTVTLSTPQVTPQKQVRLVDINGSGTKDLLWADTDNYRYIDLLGGKRPGLLTQMESGLGHSTEIAYASSTDEMFAARAAGAPWNTVVPQVVQVVKRVTVRDRLDAVGRTPGVEINEYTYRDPAFDGRSRAFRGFRGAVSKKLGDAAAPTSISKVTFLVGDCAEDGVVGRCAPESFFQENSRDALRGLVSSQTELAEDGVALSTSHRTYRLRNLYTGLDGAVVRHAFASRERAFNFDTSPFDSSPSTVSVVDVEIERQPASVVADPARDLSLPSTSRRTETRTESVVDVFGNVVESIDLGCVAGCSTSDEVITVHVPHQRPEGDGSGWLFRPAETYTTGSRAPAENRHHNRLTYDARGRLLNEWAELRGTLAVERFHETGAAIAPAPAGASQNGSVLQATMTYDDVGNLTRVTGARNQCRTYDYASVFRDFRISEITHAGPSGNNGCGTTALEVRQSYDRGLGVGRRKTGFNGDVSREDFDAFGRKTAAWQPDPENPTSLSGVPSVTYEYLLSTDPVAKPYFVVHSTGQEGESANTSSRRHVYEFFDGLGRLLVRLTEADPSAGDGGDWIASGLVDRSANGTVFRQFDPWFWSGTPLEFPLSTRPSSASTTTISDAFGRPVSVVGPDGKEKLRNAYHAMSLDVSDPADLAGGKHAGTHSSQERDGHGRLKSSSERIRVEGQLEERKTSYAYLATGEVESITRTRVGAADAPVVRWMRYDSLGRLVLNVEPNSTRNFSSNLAAAAETVKAWRYAYADDGSLVGSSDARGCGMNYHYDSAARIVAEDFSPCLAFHPAYSALSLTTGNGSEAFYRYDVADPDLAAALPESVGSGGYLGRLASTWDRASRSVLTYDGRGRVPVVLKRVAKPGVPSATLSQRFAPHWYETRARFDGADRVLSRTTGAEAAELLPPSGESSIQSSYSKRGRVRRVDSSYGTLIFDIVRNARGMTESIAYGDLATTESTFSFDTMRRLSQVRTSRGAPAPWSGPTGSYAPPAAGTPTTLQRTLVDTTIVYDDANNPTRIQDNRSASEWPAGAKPFTRDIEYDDLYRVTRVAYAAGGGDDTWTSPFDAENRAAEPARRPAPHVSFPRRVRSEDFKYDWLGNSVKTLDDTNGFYDRSLGTIENGTAAAGPYQLKSASNRSLTGSARGDLSASYDDAGNLTTLVVKRDGTCLPAAASCYQRYEYGWDEAGRLSRVKRWDLTGAERTATTAPTRAANVELRYGYDHADARVTTTTLGGGAERHTLYVFDSLEHHGTTWEATDYRRSAATEVVFLTIDGRRIGRVVPGDAALPRTAPGPHVFLELTDPLGSLQVVIDKDTSELVEYGGYRAYGDTESDYRPTRWGSFREHYKFTGQDQDIEVGLHYFGKRFYSANLGRWISADPLTIHNAGADLNAYAYVHGRPFVSADPNGQCEIVCAILIGAAVSAVFDMAMQYYQTGSVDDLGRVGIAAVSGAVGGAVGFGVGSLVTSALSKGAVGLATAKLAGSVTGGMAGGVAGGVTYRGQLGIVGMATGSMNLESAIKLTFNPQSLGIDLALGAAGGALSYGVNYLLSPRGSGGSAAPSRSTSTPKLTNSQVGKIGEAEVPRALKLTASDRHGPLQNACNHGIDCVVVRPNEVVFVEAKASGGGVPPRLSVAQADMTAFVESRLSAVLQEGSNYSPAAKALAREAMEAIQNGATVRGVVVETRYAGSPSQFTTTRPWTSTTQRSGSFLSPPPAASPFFGPGDAVRVPASVTCYSTGNGEGMRCDTTVFQW